MSAIREYDMVVIGSGPGGQKAAIAAAKLGKSVALVERGRMVGGVCVNTGTIPSKTLREAVVYLTGMSQRELYGASYRVKDKITPADLLARTQQVIGTQVDVGRSHRVAPMERWNLPRRARGVPFGWGREVPAVEVGAAGPVPPGARGRQIPAETVMYSAGREGQTEHLGLENAGLEADHRGR